MEIQKHIDDKVLKARAASWSGFGVELYKKEIQLQLAAQEIIAKLITPTKEQLKEAEQAVATVKKELEALIDERKVPTERFKKVAQRLMEPEKQVEQAVNKIQEGILKVKQELKADEKAADDKRKELVAIAEQTRVYVADMHASILKALAKLINDAYKHALEVDMPVTEVPAFIAKVSARVNAGTTTTPLPQPKFKHNTKEDVDAEVAKHFKPWTPEQYIQGFTIDIEKKFFDWELALKNKPQAEKLNTNEYTETVAAIDELKERETMTARLDAIAMPVETAPDVKPLKEVYKLEEPETIEQALEIINAFTINRALCIPEMRKIKPMNIGIKQMIAALEAVKNADNAFEVTGLLFKKIDKL